MNTAITNKGMRKKFAAYSLQETTIKEHNNVLDDNGWLIKAPGEPNQEHAIAVYIKDSNNATIAAAIVEPAETSIFQQATRLDVSALNKSIFLHSVWIAPHLRNAEIMPTILYFALRRGRILGRQNIAALTPVPNKGAPIATLLHLEPLEKVPQATINQRHYLPVAQLLKYSLCHVYQQCKGEFKELIQENFTNEIVAILQQWLDRFYHGSWAQAVINGTLTKEQYVNSLYNVHQYVRQTTRLAARCLAHSEDMDLRNHYIYHLKGEVNHELLIERDLKHLNADVDYLLNSHVPDAATKEFMVVQESTIGFYQDPLLMLACPFAAEGFAAHLKDSFLEALYQTIGGWGVKDPIEAARFISSHVHTDGGEDGHWMAVLNMMKKFIKDEHKQQQFLSVLVAAMNGFEHGFNANIDDMRIWDAAPVEVMRK